MQVGQHDDASENDLADNARHETPGQSYEIGPSRNTAYGPENGDDHPDGHQSGEETIHLLDGTVSRRNVDEPLLVAPRPVLATETRTGESHGGPGDHDRAQKPEGDHGESPIRQRGHGLTLRRDGTAERNRDG
jgi:hypothetical protein